MGCYESKLAKDSYGGNTAKIQQVLGPRPSGVSPRHNSHKNKRNHHTTKNPQNNSKSKPKRGRRNSPIAKDVIGDRRINTKYKVKAVIGKGTFSRVVRVEDRLTRQPYAIKMIETSEGRSVFEAELTVLRRVNHPNVIRLIEVFESNQKILMVMELATGGSLLDRLEACGPYGEQEAQGVLRMVLSGLHYLHTLGITHRDLKPDNLLYYHPGHHSKLFITDFGFASTRKSNGSSPFMQTVCGTPQYIAPEIVARRPYTSSVDMWAIGVIHFILLSGSFPFDAPQDSLIFKQILKGKYSFAGTAWSNVSSEAKDFIGCLLQHNPNDRLTAFEASNHPWVTQEFPPATFSTPSVIPGLHRTGSQRSSQSAGSTRSCRSLRSEHHRVQPHQLEALQADPDIVALL